VNRQAIPGQSHDLGSQIIPRVLLRSTPVGFWSPTFLAETKLERESRAYPPPGGAFTVCSLLGPSHCSTGAGLGIRPLASEKSSTKDPVERFH
jgi:hypothetical protein